MARAGVAWRSAAVVDWGVAAGLTVLAQLQLAAFTNLRTQSPALSAAGYALTALQTLPVGLRRRAPFPILLLTGAAAFLQLLLRAKSADFGTFGVLVAFYTVAAESSRWLANTIAVLAIVGIFVAKLLDVSMQLHLDDLLVLYAQFAAAWLLGDNARYRRRHIADLEERTAAMEREREYRAREAVADERARIARELHDVVTHSLCVMLLQAGAARTVLDSAPDTARACLVSIESVGRQAWAEMRHLVDLVRRDGAYDVDVRPRPSLGDLTALIRRFEEAGLTIEVRVTGAARSLSAAMDLCAYRIVQEALTNTLKHAGRVHARISVAYEEEALELVIADDGRPLDWSAGALEPAGNGLVGMRERVQLFGGQLYAGPGPGGFRVWARLPLEPETARA